MSAQDVWITGAGVVCAAGEGLESLRAVLASSRSTLERAAGFEFETARIKEFRLRPATRRLERSAQLFFAAAEAAWADSGLDDERIDPRRTAVIEGSSLGPLSEVLNSRRDVIKHPGRAVRPSHVVRFMTGAGGAVMAQTHGIRGPVMYVSAASVSAMCAIGEACEKILAGRMDVVVAGGAECPLDPEVVDTFRAAGILGHSQRDGVPSVRRTPLRNRAGGRGWGSYSRIGNARRCARRTPSRPNLGFRHGVRAVFTHWSGSLWQRSIRSGDDRPGIGPSIGSRVDQDARDRHQSERRRGVCRPGARFRRQAH